MTHRTASMLAFSVGLALTFTGCANGGGAPVEVQMRAFDATGGGLANPDAGDGVFAVHQAVVHVRDIELYLPEGVDCDEVDAGVACERDSDKLVVEGPFTVDLIEGTVQEIAMLPAGTYRRVDVRVDDVGDEVSFRAAGDYRRGPDTVAIELAFDFGEDIRFEGEIAIEEDQDVQALVLGLDVSQWIEPAPLQDCLERDASIPDGIVIGEDNSGSGSCSDLENDLRDNIEGSGALLSL